MPNVERMVKVITTQQINPTKDSGQGEGYPMRDWAIEVYLKHETTGLDVPARVFDAAKYTLHPTFGKRAVQTFKTPPFRIAEEGWGEFDMKINLLTAHKGGDHEIKHDLNFQSERYEHVEKVVFKNPKAEVLALLRESGPVPGDGGEGVNGGGVGKGKGEAGKKRARKEKNVDMDKLANGLQQLGEDDLLHVVQLVHDNKSSDTYTKNDVEAGEFHVDLYTLPDPLVKMLWDFTATRVDIAAL